MKRKTVTISLMSILLFSITSKNLSAQDTTKQEIKKSTWGIQLNGFIRTDAYYDSRLSSTLRPANDGGFLLYPLAPSLDANGKDLNGQSSVSMTAIFTRLTVNITGPDAFGAKTSGMIEGEFAGITSSSAGYSTGSTATSTTGTEGLFRLRHAFAKLDWSKTQLAFGQYWHPFLASDCFPSTVSLNAGTPFQPFGRVPQIRLTQKLNSTTSIIIAAIEENESCNSYGTTTNIALTAPVSNPFYLYYSKIPNLHAQIRYKHDWLLLGAAIDYKSLQPALKDTVSDKTYMDNTKVNSVSLEGYGKITTNKVIVKAEYVAGQNLADLLQIGGYAAYGKNGDNTISYKPIKVNSSWIEFSGTGTKIIWGLFAGYSKNKGTSSDDAVVAYARGIAVSPTIANSSVDHLFRIAPRCEFVSGKFKLSPEIEYTSATYGKNNSNLSVNSSSLKTVGNTRVLFAATFTF